jgi:hypothetical protein
MDAFDRLVEKHFPKEGPLKMLIEMVEKELDGFVPKRVLKEGAVGKSCEDVDERYIPTHSPTEFGWKIETPKEGSAKPVDPPPQARKELDQWLKGIAPGSGLKEKIDNLSNFFERPMEYVEAFGGTEIDNTITTMSFLGFYKTLTDVITNFNASSAGFTFEAFLATLLGGYQVPAAGAETIGDMIDSEGKKISLKLYDLKGAKAGGSWRQLVKDLQRDKMMQYVVVTKQLTGEDLSLEGTLDWYRWNFTLENVFNIMSQTGSRAGGRRDFILLPKGFVSGEWSSDILPVAGMADVEDMKQLFAKYVKDRMKKSVKSGLPTEEGVSELLRALDWGNPSVHGKNGPGQSALSTRHAKDAIVSTIENNPDQFTRLDKVDPGWMFDVISGRQRKPVSAGRSVINYNTSAKAVSKRGLDVLKDKKMWLTPEQSLMWYNDPSRTDEERMAALENCKGTLAAQRGGETQFELNLKNIQNVVQIAGNTPGLFDEDQDKVLFGTVRVGRQNMYDLFTRAGDLIDNNLGQIWCHLDNLTRNLQQWYGSQLEDSEAAAAAQDAARTIREKTAEEIEKKQ